MLETVTLPSGDKVLTDKVSTVDGAAAPTDSEAQLVKFGIGAVGEFKNITPADPMPTHDPDAATEATLTALNATAAAVQAACEAMQTVLGTINSKITAANTGAIAGTVALDSGTLAALETINATTGGLTDAELRASPLALPTGAATESSLAAINTKLPAKKTGTAKSTDDYLPIASIPAHTLRYRFDKVISGDVDGAVLDLLQTGSGQTVNQSGGSLVITTGTTANAETIVRALEPVDGNIVLRAAVTLSQRIINQSFFIELVDVIGDSLPYSLTNSTTMVVTFTGTPPFSAQNVGQGLYASADSNISGASQRVTIASVSGNTVTFTGTGWPASGTGTVDLFGWNYHQCLYDNTVATTMQFDSQGNGWRSGNTAATINTTLSTHVFTLAGSDGEAVLMDQTGGSATGLEVTRRASRIRNAPDNDCQLYMQIRVVNGVTAPLSSTTFTVGFVDILHGATQPVTIQNISPMSANSGLPMEIVGSITIPVSGTVTANVAASTNLIGDVGQQYRGNATGAGTPTSITSPATPAGSSIKAAPGRLVGFVLFNNSTGVRWFKFFNSTSVTMGTTAALFEIAIPAGGSREIAFEAGVGFSTGIMWAVTAARGLTDNTATGLVVGDVTGITVHA